jgi:NTP pyrophosphatase (non-canonical NTP hydrolase)
MWNKLSFDTLRTANRARLPQFKNAKGLPAHSHPEGHDWSVNDWMTALVGEVGEAANILKKIRRGDFGEEVPGNQEYFDALLKVRSELADIQIYLDLLAHNIGIDLGSAVVDKFNEVSKRVDSTIFLVADHVGMIHSLDFDREKVRDTCR